MTAQEINQYIKASRVLRDDDDDNDYIVEPYLYQKCKDSDVARRMKDYLKRIRNYPDNDPMNIQMCDELVKRFDALDSGSYPDPIGFTKFGVPFWDESTELLLLL